MTPSAKPSRTSFFLIRARACRLRAALRALRSVGSHRVLRGFALLGADARADAPPPPPRAQMRDNGFSPIRTMPMALSACMLLCLFSACRPASDTPAPKVFHFNSINPVTSLDPAFARNQAGIWAMQQMYSTLVTLDDSLHVVTDLASRWQISPDGLTYTFTLRPDVFFHNDACFAGGKGRRLTAADVAYSLGRIVDTTVASSGSWIFEGRIRAVTPFEALNDSTFVLHLSSPFLPMMGILTMQYCSVVPHEAVQFYGSDFRQHPVGSGPFRLKKWLEGQGLFMTRNPAYYRRDASGHALPYLDGVRMSFMPDRKTAYLEAMKGKLDFFSGLESGIVNELLTPEGELQPKHNGNLQLVKSPYLNSEYLGICTDCTGGEVFKDKRIRQALNWAIDRRQMLATLRNNIGQPADAGFTPRGLPSFDATATPGYHYRPDIARKLLAEAGYPAGKGLPTLQLYTNKDYLDICTFLAKQWQEVGLQVSIETQETATLREMMTKGNVPFFRASWLADYPDAESFLTCFYSKNPSPPNYTRFKNTTYDRLYEAALQETDDAKRYDLYHQLDRILIEEAPVVFLFYDETSRFARQNIKNLSRNAMNLLPLQTVREE